MKIASVSIQLFSFTSTLSTEIINVITVRTAADKVIRGMKCNRIQENKTDFSLTLQQLLNYIPVRGIHKSHTMPVCDGFYSLGCKI